MCNPIPINVKKTKKGILYYIFLGETTTTWSDKEAEGVSHGVGVCVRERDPFKFNRAVVKS